MPNILAHSLRFSTRRAESYSARLLFKACHVAQRLLLTHCTLNAFNSYVSWINRSRGSWLEVRRPGLEFSLPKMATEDLHSVYGGVLGAHLPQIVRNVGELVPMGVTKLLEPLDCRLHRIYTHHKPGLLRLPAFTTFFTNRYATPNYELRQFSGSSPL